MLLIFLLIWWGLLFTSHEILLRLFYQAIHPSWIPTFFSDGGYSSCRYLNWCCYCNTTVVQTQKVVINALVYLVYGYYNSSTIKARDGSFLVIGSFFVFLVNSNFVHNVICNISLTNTYILAFRGGHSKDTTVHLSCTSKNYILITMPHHVTIGYYAP